MDIRKLSLRSLVFAAAAVVPIAGASAAMAHTTTDGIGGNAPLVKHLPPPPPPARCKPYSPKNQFVPGPNKPGQGWCTTYCTPKEYGRWVRKGHGWEWTVTDYKGKRSIPACKPTKPKPPQSPPPRQNPPPKCPPGQKVLPGQKCGSGQPPQPPTCQQGQKLVNGKCVTSPAPPTCQQGQKLVNGKCVTSPAPPLGSNPNPNPKMPGQP